ncbi:restriction endonuclease [Hyphomonadaceae bacterium ML37]|nr:restriction endonuclease [Hyphomonadaceae bacterium ML37]
MTGTPNDLPKFSELMPLVIEALQALGGSASIDELNEWVASRLQLSEAELEITYPKSGDYVFRDRVSWARSYLKQGGYVDNSQRGVWTITPEGRQASLEDIAQVPRRVVTDYNRRKAKEAPGLDEAISDARDWKEELLDHLGQMAPEAFERLCQRVLREKGFTKVEVTGRGGDGGIDGQGVLRVNLLSFQVIFQAKRWKGSVGASVVRDFRGAMIGRADKGLIMTTARFTTEASREATRDGAPAIDLVDGEDFCELLKEIRLGVRVRMVEEVEVSASDLAEI